MQENEKNIFLVIHDGYGRFTTSEKKIADYVLAHKTEVQFMSISELADECGVAESTLSRFCRRLELKSYSGFKLALAKATVNPTERAEELNRELELSEDGRMAEECRSLYVDYTEALKQTATLVRPDQVRLAVDYMMEAERVYCMGQGGSMLMAMETAHLMSTVSPRFFAVQDSHTQVSAAALMDERDVVLFFSYSGSTIEIVDLIQLAKERGAKVVLITRFLRSPGAKLADVVLQCGSLEGPLQLGTVPAKMAQLFVVDVLYREFCRRNPESSQANRELIAQALAGKHL